MTGASAFKAIPADTAINLYTQLLEARRLQLQPALGQAVRAVGVARIDPELQQLVPATTLNHLATLGLRGERVFPVPAIITHAPPLIGYYRMLLGLSKKEFGQSGRLGYQSWVSAEESGIISARLAPHAAGFCAALIAPLVRLVDAMSTFGDRELNDLTLLTPGSTLQGGRNNVIGTAASRRVFDVLRRLVTPWATFSDTRLVRFTTARGDFELLEGSDPDIRLDAGAGTHTTPVLAIEIKGGSDASNAHNRAGEAEKSHLKAYQTGYNEQWTVMVISTVSRAHIRTKHRHLQSCSRPRK